MNWIILIVAGFFESGFAFCLGKMKEVAGTEYYLWGAGFLASLTLSMVLLAKAVQTLPIGTAYPVWTGMLHLHKYHADQGLQDLLPEVLSVLQS